MAMGRQQHLLRGCWANKTFLGNVATLFLSLYFCILRNCSGEYSYGGLRLQHLWSSLHSPWQATVRDQAWWKCRGRDSSFVWHSSNDSLWPGVLPGPGQNCPVAPWPEALPTLRFSPSLHRCSTSTVAWVSLCLLLPCLPCPSEIFTPVNLLYFWLCLVVCFFLDLNRLKPQGKHQQILLKTSDERNLQWSCH